jgi:hypothetical protein
MLGMANQPPYNIAWDCKYHVVWTPKYRRKVLTDHLKEIIHDVCQEHEAKIIEVEVMPDHTIGNRSAKIFGEQGAFQIIVNLRENHHWQLAHQLCDADDVMIFETLNMRGMQRM